MCKSFRFFSFFFNFCTKSHFQNPHRYDFEFFVKKVNSYILQKLSTLREIIMLSGKISLFFFVFPLIFSIIDESKFHFFQSFFPQSRPRRPLPQCCWENVKKCQNFTYEYFDKNSKNTIINRETVFRKTTLSMGKSPNIFRSFKG